MAQLVTGVAGFIGSQLAESLVEAGETVIGVDCLTPYYDREVKKANLCRLLSRRDGRFRMHEADLRTAELDELLRDVEIVYHQAAQPGVRLSWSEGFQTYDECNVLATQRLLEAVRRSAERADGVRRVVYASSSSVYGNALRYPVVESDVPRPHSPYGVTKMAAEHLCTLYADNYGVSTVSLRYFTVYGPRQRPDMAHHRLVEAALDHTAFPLFGDGSAVRDFTFVDDVVRANVLAGRAEVTPGTVVNICAGGSTPMRELIETVGEAVGHPVPVDKLDEQPGDVARTGGCNDKAAAQLGWSPRTELVDGIRAQVDWHRRRRR
jgi:UDP-glucuronate 4-epimerase